MHGMQDGVVFDEVCDLFFYVAAAAAEEDEVSVCFLCVGVLVG